jgi:hypothetical protein
MKDLACNFPRLWYDVHRIEGEEKTTMRKVRCQSGLMGWRCFLQENYTDFEDFQYYDDLYALAKRLGYENAESIWKQNPLIESSVEPYDLRVVWNTTGIFHRKKY